MKIAICLSFLAFCLFFCDDRDTRTPNIDTEPPVLTANVFPVNEAVGGYYSGLPVRYQNSTQVYPVIIFIHGAGQYGNGDSELYRVLDEGIPELLNQQRFPPNFTVSGRNYSFVVLAPQFRMHPDAEQVMSFINYAKETYRIDDSRIYLAGFSEGGRIACDVAAAYGEQLAALIAIAGVSQPDGIEVKCRNIADDNLPLWLLHNDEDLLMDVNLARRFVSLINSYNPTIEPKYTEFLPYGLWNHDAWTKATDPAFKEGGMNIYEWMLQYRR